MADLGAEGAENTDRELWRERLGDFYADSVFVTEGGSIGMQAGGYVIVKPIRQWVAITSERDDDAAEITRLRSQLAAARDALNLVRDGLRNLPRSKTADQIDVICAEALATPSPIADAMVAVVEAASEFVTKATRMVTGYESVKLQQTLLDALKSLDEARSK